MNNFKQVSNYEANNEISGTLGIYNNDAYGFEEG